jgi:hypothetical protein
MLAAAPRAVAESVILSATSRASDSGYHYDLASNSVATNGAGRLPTAETWGRLDTLDDHFLRHGADFGASTADEYAALASDFFESGIARGLPTRIDPKTGVIRIYDPATNSHEAADYLVQLIAPEQTYENGLLSSPMSIALGGIETALASAFSMPVSELRAKSADDGWKLRRLLEPGTKT